jgi:thiol-disulfide isomerase/thioredoxin
MKRLLTTALLVVATLVTACSSDGVRSGDPSAVAGSVGLTRLTTTEPINLHALIGTTLTGRELSASSYATGSPLVINVWASWCSPCRQESTLLARAAHEGIRILGIDERDNASRAASFAAGHDLTYPSLRDPDGGILASLQVLPRTGIPSTLFVDAGGTARARIVGPLQATTLRRALRMVTS